MVALNESYQTSTPTPAQEWNRRVEQNLEDSQILAQLKWATTNSKLNPQCEKAVCEKGVNNGSYFKLFLQIEEYLMTTTDLTTTTEEATTLPPSDEQVLRHRELVGESTEVGVMFASKPIVQAITNPFVGPLTNKSVIHEHSNFNSRNRFNLFFSCLELATPGHFLQA